ncbi:hypothetical protein TL16_g02809 [Triparma laevis f. inornata]|uniref:Uncharacterized protein n=1 Tax=Triparma laevis f. inornata TaxID=1714386 RepID=A0A9W6ZVV3_9STRA|nr:hypothetical protein TL16_g02809 [Triparma laevis f. inornata]
MQPTPVESTYQSFDTDRYSNISHSVRSPSRVTGFVYFESGNEDATSDHGQGADMTEEDFGDLVEEGFSDDDEVVIDEMGEDGLDFSLQISDEEAEEEQSPDRSRRKKQPAESSRAHYMDPTFASKMHESDVIVPDDVKEFRQDESFTEKKEKVKVKAKAKNPEKDDEDEAEVRPLETVDEFRNRMARNSPSPKPKMSPEDEGIKKEVEGKATSFLGNEGASFQSNNNNPPLPSEIWEMVKEGYEAKITAAAKDADRTARREERRKYREKNIANRLNDTSGGGSSTAEPEIMVDRAATRALAGDVEGARAMLERKRGQKIKREAIAVEKLRAQVAKKKRREARQRKREAIERLKEKKEKKEKERARRKKKGKKRKVESESSSSSDSTSDTSSSDSDDSLESSSDSSVEIPIVRSLSKSSKSIHDTINTVAKTLTHAIGDPISNHKAFYQTPLEAVTEVLPFVDEDGLLGAVDTDMLELRRIQSKLSYQLGRLSTTLNNVATAAKASEKVGHEKAFLMGRTGRSEAERGNDSLKRNPHILMHPPPEQEEEKKEGRISPDSLNGVYDTLEGREERVREEEQRRAYELQRRAHEEAMLQQQLRVTEEMKRQEQMYVPLQVHQGREGQQMAMVMPPNTTKLQNLTKRIYANTGSTGAGAGGPVNSYPFSAPNTSLSSAYLLGGGGAPPQIRTPTYPSLQTNQRMTQDFTKPVLYPLKVRGVSIGGSNGGGNGGNYAGASSVIGSQTGRQSPNFAVADNLMRGLDVQTQAGPSEAGGPDNNNNYYVPPREPVQIDPVKLVNTGTAADRVLRMMDQDGYRFSDAINEYVKRND